MGTIRRQSWDWLDPRPAKCACSLPPARITASWQQRPTWGQRQFWPTQLPGLLCMLSHFSCVQLFVTPWTAAHQARILEWVAISFSTGIFSTQGLNPGLLHCRQILYRLSYTESCCHWFKTFNSVQLYQFRYFYICSFKIKDICISKLVVHTFFFRQHSRSFNFSLFRYVWMMYSINLIFF